MTGFPPHRESRAPGTRRGGAPHRIVRPRGFSLVEAVIGILIVSIMMAAALTVLGSSRAGQARVADRSCGHQLALDLMNEILRAEYLEPDDPPLFGPEGAEAAGGRAYFDDVDDYAGLSESPPLTRAGVPMPGLDGWTRSMAVEWARPGDLAATSPTDTGIKRITVTVLRGTVPVARLVAIRTAAWTLEKPAMADPSGNRPPTAVLRADAAAVAAGTLLSFNGGGSTDADGDPLTYSWNFGDGATASGPTAVHTYAAPGVYTATLTVRDGRGGVAADRLAIIVTP